MLRSLWLLMVYVSFLGLGTAAPFVLALGYVWVDTFRPQEVAFVILNQLPVAMIMGASAVFGYFLLDRRSPPPLTIVTVLNVAMAAWVTATLVWAVAPDQAWDKWDWAFKTLVFAAFIPLVIRSRVQIEAFAQTYLLSLAANFIPFGAKVLLSGGGYGANLGLSQGNSGLAEGGFLSTACLMAIPLALFLARNTQLMPRWALVSLAYWGIALLALLTAIGTYQRSALVGLVAMAAFMTLRAKRKLLFISIAAIAGLVIVLTTSDRWNERVSSITEYRTEGSALTRILVWKWTLDFVATHPLGGGFQSYVVNHVTLPPDPANPGGIMQFGRAFHSVYFEVLGEHGWPGLFLFLATAGFSFGSTYMLGRRTRSVPELAWCADFAVAIQSGLIAFLVCGAFVGIAFQPMFWYFVAMSVSLRAHVWHAQRQQGTSVTGWRATGQLLSPATATGAASGWHPKPVAGAAKRPSA